jgi:hypothetical protein
MSSSVDLGEVNITEASQGKGHSRRRLPDRRGSVTFDVDAFVLRFTVTASRFGDGLLGEIFIQDHKADSSAGIMASDGAIAASLALQFGCPVEVLRKALSRDARGRATGPLGTALDQLAADRGAV